MAKGLTVRDAEALAQKPLGDAVKAAAKAQPKDPDTLALERRLADGLGLTVSLAHRATGAVKSASATPRSSNSMKSAAASNRVEGGH